jgi:retron-type reverse transcriptase
MRRDRGRGYDGYALRIDQIGDRDNLYQCYRQLLHHGGPAAGVDELRAADLSPSEAGNYMGVLSACVRHGTYRPNPVRVVPIPKPGSHEWRQLKIGTLGDRIIGKALHHAFAPVWEQHFLPCSYGFRRQRNTWMLLADLETRMQTLNRWVVAIADIRRAFDTVAIHQVIALHDMVLDGITQQKFTPKDKACTLALIDTVLRGHDAERTRGIDQGGPYSPTALNVLLHYMLDVPVMAHVDNKPLWYRYADNLVYLAQSVSEGKAMLGKVTQLLQPLGLTLKAEAEVTDLSTGGTAQLLGFSLRQDGDQIHYGIGPAAWDNLQHHLGAAHVERDPPSPENVPSHGKESLAHYLSCAFPTD